MRKASRVAGAVVWLGVALTAIGAAPALGGPYSRLQVLLPGESAAPGTGTGKTGSPQAQVAGFPFTVTVRACDSQWNLVSTVTDAIQILSTDASATLPAAQQLQSGAATFTVTLNAAGSFTMFAHDQSDNTIPDGVSAPATVQVLQTFQFSSISNKGQHAGQAITVTITARDPAAGLVRGFSGTVSLKELTTDGDGPVLPATVTLSAGTWTGSLTAYRADETSRGANFYAWLASRPEKNGSSNPFTLRPGNLARVQIVVPGQAPLSGSASGVSGSPSSQIAGRSFTVGVYSTDTWWNKVSTSDVVRITSSDPAAVLPGTGALSSGYRTFSVSLGTVGTQTLTVADVSRPSLLSMTSTGISVVPSAIDHFEIGAIASPQVAGAPVTVTIRAADANGNTITGFTSDAVLIPNTGQGSVSPEQITFGSGVWSGPMVFRGAGAAVSFSCSDFASPPHTGRSNSFAVQPGPLAGLQVLLPGQTAQGGTADGKSGAPVNQTAGASFTLTVRAVDAYWNLVGGIGDRVALGSTDAFAGLPAETTLSNGQALIPARLYRSGLQRVWADDLDQPSARADTSSEVRVVGGPFARLLVLAPGESPAPGTATGRTGTPIDQSINYGFTVAVLAADSWWNPVNGVTDVVHLTSTDPMATLAPDAAMVDGRADMTVRLATGGFQQITAADVTQPARGSSTTQVRAISSGFHLEASVSPASVRAGEPFTLTVKVTNDAGSVIQEINSVVTIEAQNATDGRPGRGVLLTTQFQLLQGQRSVSQSYSFAEPIVLVVRDDAGNAPGVTGVVTVGAGPPATIHLTSDPAWVGGNKHAAVTARLVDAFENGIAGQPMSFQLVSGTGTLTALDSDTDTSGVARADFLSPRMAETDRIRAASGGITADLDVETSLVDPGAPGGYVTNYPNPFHPPGEPTRIAYKLDDDAAVTLRVFTQSGDLVRQETFARSASGGRAGINEWPWDGRNGTGALVSSGGYLVLIEAQGQGGTLHVIRRKIAVVR